MREEVEERIRDIFWEELSGLLHEIDTEAGEPPDEGGDTNTARGLLRRLFIHARSENIRRMAASGELARISRGEDDDNFDEEDDD